jgi:putative lipoprotein
MVLFARGNEMAAPKFFVLLIYALLVGCAGDGVRAANTDQAFRPDERPLAKTLVYDCNGFEFTARLGPGEMALWLPDRYVVLSQVRSASGTKYQEGDIEFWSKGDEAMLTVGNEQYLNCALVPQRVPWEDARRRGVDFRAVGNEPGWFLEIQQGKHLLFVGDFGSRRVVTPDPGEQAQDGARTWHAVTESADLKVEVVQETCIDNMSGEQLPDRVTVTLDATVLYGCGRDLENPWQ